MMQLTKEGRELLRNVDAERRLKRIARAGKEWKRTMGRKVDMEGEFCVYFSVFLSFPRGSLRFGLTSGTIFAGPRVLPILF